MAALVALSLTASSIAPWCSITARAPYMNDASREIYYAQLANQESTGAVI